MTRWEYKIVHKDTLQTVDAMTLLGIEGWELVGFQYYNSDKPAVESMRAVFKRPLGEFVGHTIINN